MTPQFVELAERWGEEAVCPWCGQDISDDIGNDMGGWTVTQLECAACHQQCVVEQQVVRSYRAKAKESR